MKKVFTFILVFTFVFNVSILPFAFATEAGSLSDIHISYHNGLSTTLKEGDTLSLYLVLTNISGTELKDVYINILESESFYPIGSGSLFTTEELDVDNLKFGLKDSIPIMYNGGSGQKLSIRIMYTKVSEGGVETQHTVLDYIGIKTAKYVEPIISPPIDTSKNTPRLTVSYPSGTVVEAGKNISLPLTIRNSSNYSAQNLLITPSFDGQDIPFVFSQVSASNNISSISPNSSREYTLNFYTKPTAEEKTYQLKLNYKYANAHGDSFDSSETIFINVTNKNSFPKFIIPNINMSSESLMAGETMNLGFSLQNIGNLGAKDIKIALNGLKTNGLTILNTSNVRYITKVLGGTQNYVSYSLHASDKIEPGLYELDIHLEYKDDTNNPYEETHKIFVPVSNNSNNSSSSKSIPKIIIDQYESSPNMVSAGDNFYLNLSFLNTHSSKAIQNIKIFLTVDEKTETSGNVFTPVNSSNTFFIDYIGPKSKINKSIQLYTVPDAKQKTYTISANFEYEDVEGNEHKASELIGIPVIQPARLETSELSLPYESYVGQPFPISLEFYNMGKVTLYNLMVKADGNFQIEHGNYFVGNFESGNHDYYEAYIIPTSPGELGGSIVFSFDDPSGEKVELRKDFSLNVIEMKYEEMPPEFYDNFPPPSNKKKYMIWAISALFVLISSGLTVFLIRRRKNKQEGMFLDE